MRYPFAELERLLLVQIGPRLTSHGQHAGKPLLLAEALGVDRKQVLRWRRYGLTLDQAESCALTAGFVSYEVWPEWVEALLVACARDGCGERFVPTRRTHVCCSKRCARAMWARTERGKASTKAATQRWRESVPEYVARVDRESGARWRAANRERKRASDKAYYERTAEQQRARRRERYAERKRAETKPCFTDTDPSSDLPVCRETSVQVPQPGEQTAESIAA